MFTTTLLLLFTSILLSISSLNTTSTSNSTSNSTSTLTTINSNSTLTTINSNSNLKAIVINLTNLTFQEEKNIRNRGTYTIALVNVSDKLDIWNLESNTVQDPSQIQTQQSNRQFRLMKQSNSEIQQLLNQSDPRPTNLFLGYKIELPQLCKPFLSVAQKLEISKRGHQYQLCWIQSVSPSLNNPIYNDLPYLTVIEFSKFYVCFQRTNRMYSKYYQSIKQNDSSIYDQFSYRQTPQDIEKDSEIDEKLILEYPEAIFNVYNSNQYQEQPISWLKFWVGICSGDKKVQPKYWKIKDNSIYKSVSYQDNRKQDVNMAVRQFYMKNRRKGQIIYQQQSDDQ